MAQTRLNQGGASLAVMLVAWIWWGVGVKTTKGMGKWKFLNQDGHKCHCHGLRSKRASRESSRGN